MHNAMRYELASWSSQSEVYPMKNMTLKLFYTFYFCGVFSLIYIILFTFAKHIYHKPFSLGKPQSSEI